LFVEKIFSKSVDILKDGKWTHGEYVDFICNWYQDNPRTIRVSARDHMKSMAFYAYIMWLIWKHHDENAEGQYFSYNAKMAAYHTAKIKTAIQCNPYFAAIIDKKAYSESGIDYSWDGVTRFTITPRGLLEFKRGIHSRYIFVDDPMQDPENKLIPTKITRINDIMRTQILDMAQRELHIVGTPQTNGDFFFDPSFTSRFSVKILPAVVSDEKRISLWPEWMDYDELMAKKKERGDKAFNQEYLCSPVYAEEAFITPSVYDLRVNKGLRNWSIEEWAGKDHEDQDRIGGFDIGKRSHPSHFVVFEKRPTKDDPDHLVQIHSKWMDNWDYNDQIEYLKDAADTFGIYSLRYDNTRGEFESMEERNELPACMEPINFTHKSKHAMAADFDRALSNGDVELLDDPRQRSQVLIVTNDLQAPVTPEGHGDAFFSLCLAVKDYQGAQLLVTVV
jgi:hypothetical protein